MDQRVRRGILKAEGVSGQSTSVVQATTRYSTPPVLHSNIEGDQLCFLARVGPGAEVDLLC